jgi:signal transduction histidine kinase
LKLGDFLIKNYETNYIGEEQEWASTKIMMMLFYFVVIVYDFLYYFIFPLNLLKDRTVGLPEHGIYGILYPVITLLFPLSIYLYKKHNVYYIKYIYFFTFQVLSSINDILVTGDKPYQGGNLFDIVLVLISPIFFNKRFFWIISIGAILKYTITGVILKETVVITPILIILIFMVGSYIIISRLIKYINAVKDSDKVIAESEKLAAVGELAAGITHEIRNPLSSLKGFIQLNKAKIEKSHYEIMIKEINRINNITSELLHLAKPQSYKIKKINIDKVIDYALDLLKGKLEEAGIKVQKNFSENLPRIDCAEGQLIQVFVNLIKNSIEAMEDGGVLSIEMQETKENVIIMFKDTGIGISEENLNKIGDSFFTTKKAGTGLGITVCKKIIHDHNGDIKIFSKEEEGTTIKILLPKK